MNISLRFFLIVSILIYLGIIIHFLKKRELNLRYSLIWIFSAVSMLLVSIFPEIIITFTSFVGIVDVVNSVFVLEGMFVLLIVLSLTAIVSHLNEKNRQLIQAVALLEKRVRVLENHRIENKKDE
ncbi:DUF2304 family protein [Acetobacterium fimetarium]|uniref:DUF2304 family protein n=1 Tax=Acetobacterium fimetarium TaxID=52691 RepID=A0ABR6WV42_9FIRM|nr:DUF2304 domain-containing protein [Acetobacterium fimetarium]MBC3804482.1 DUF2304 family protein [Acetobacterium fimetarium]